MFKSIAGIDIAGETEGSLRSTYDILSDLAGVWENLNAEQRQMLGDAAAGNRQVKVLNAIMLGWQDVEKAVNSANNSQGSALKENEKFLNSIQGLTNQMTSAFQQMATNFISSDFMKGLIKLNTEIIKGIDNFGGLGNALFAVVGILSAVKFSKIANAFSTLRTFVTNLSTGFSLAKTSGLGLSATFKEIGISASLAQVGIAAATLALTLIVGAISAAKQAEEERKQKAIDATEASNKEADSLIDLYEAYQDYASMTSRTTSQEEDFQTVIEDITTALGEKATALEGLKKGTEEYTAALKEATQEELKSRALGAIPGLVEAKKDIVKITRNSTGVAGSVDIPLQGGLLQPSGYPSAELQKQVEEILAPFLEEGVSNRYKSYRPSVNSPTDAVEYYYRLADAKNAFLEASQKNKDESILESVAYKEISEALNAYSSAVETYLDFELEYQQLDYMYKNGIPDTLEGYQRMADAIILATGAGEEFAKVIRSQVVPAQSELNAQSGKSVTTGTSASSETDKAIKQVTQVYEDRLKTEEFVRKRLEQERDRNIAAGLKVPESNYEDLLLQSQGIRDTLLEEQEALIAARQELMDDNLLVEESEDWYAWEHAIEDVTLRLGDATSKIDAYQRAVDGLPLDALKSQYETIQGHWDKLKTNIEIAESQGRDVSPFMYSNQLHYAEMAKSTAQAIVAEMERLQGDTSLYAEDIKTWNGNIDQITISQGKLNTQIADMDVQSYRDAIKAADDLQTAFDERGVGTFQGFVDSLDEEVALYDSLIAKLTELNRTDEIAQAEKDRAAAVDQRREANNRDLNILLDKIAAEKDKQEVALAASNDLKVTTPEQYEGLIKLGDSEKAVYQEFINLNKQWQQGYDIRSTEYQEFQKVIDEYTTLYDQVTAKQKEWNAAITALPIERLDQAIERTQGDRGLIEANMDAAKQTGKAVTQQQYNDAIATYQNEIYLLDAIISNLKEQKIGKSEAEIKAIDDQITARQTTQAGLRGKIGELKVEKLYLSTDYLNRLITDEQDKRAVIQDKMDTAETNHLPKSPADLEALISSSQREELYNQIFISSLKEAQSYTEEGSELYTLLGKKIKEYEGNVRSAQKAQAEWNETLKSIPVEELDKHLEWLKSEQEVAQVNIDNAKKSGSVSEATYSDMGSLLSDEMATIAAKKAKLEEAKKTAEEEARRISSGGILSVEDQSSIDAYYDPLINQLEVDYSGVVERMAGLGKEIGEIPLQALRDEYDKLDAMQTSIETDIRLTEAKGGTPSDQQYTDLVAIGNKKIEFLQKENDLLKLQQEASAGNVEEQKRIGEEIESNNLKIKEIQISQAGWNDSVTKAQTALEKWKAALEAPETGDNYRDVTDAIDKMLELLKDGEVGTKKFKAGLELLVPKSLKGDLKGTEAYLKKLKDYFAEGPGGAKKFQKELAKIAPNLASYNEKTGEFSLFTKDPKKIATAMGWSEEAVRAMIGRMNELLVSGEGWTLDPVKLEYDATQAETTLSKLNLLPLLSKTAKLIYEVVYQGGTPPALAKGTKDAKEGPALVGEAGAEIVYNKRKRYWWLARNPQITHLNKGDVVYNNRQTRDMLGGGSGSLSGGAFADGTSKGLFKNAADFLSGLVKDAVKWASGLTKNGGSGTTSDNDSGGGGGGKKKDPGATLLTSLEKLYDWAARALEKANKATQDIIDSAKNFIGYYAQNQNINSAIKSTRSEIAKSEKAYALYLAKAEEIASKTGLSADMVRKIQEGDISLEELDDKTKKKVEAYQEWYDKAEAVKDSIKQLREQEDELAKQKLDNITEYYDNRVARLDAQIDRANALVDNKAASGREVTASDYNTILTAAADKIGMLTDARTALNEEFTTLVASGVIQQDSESWHEYTGRLEELDTAIIEADTDLQGFKDTIAQISITKLQYGMEALQATAESLQALQDLVASQGGTQAALSYLSLIANSKLQVENLEAQNAALLEQQSGIDVLSEKYQEIQGKITQNQLAILRAKIQQEEWNDAIGDIDIANLQKQKEELQKTNDVYKKQLELQQAEEELQAAKQRRTRILKDGQFVWEASQKAITDAQNKLDDLRNQAIIDAIDDAIEAIESLKDTNNLYDALGNLLPQYASGTPMTREGLAYLHDNEMVLNSKQAANLWKMLDGGYGAYMASEGLTRDIGSLVKIAPALGRAGALPSINIGKIEMSGVNDAEAFVKDMLNNFPLQLQQQMRKH